MSMLTTHYFNQGNRRCIHCGQAEDDVEFRAACPSRNAVLSRVVVAFDFVTTRFEVPVVDVRVEVGRILARDLMLQVDREMSSMAPIS